MTDTPLTTAQAAEVMGIPLPKVQQLIKAGKLKAKNISCGSIKPRYQILPIWIDEFYGLVEPSESAGNSRRKKKSNRIDESCPKVFG